MTGPRVVPKYDPAVIPFCGSDVDIRYVRALRSLLGLHLGQSLYNEIARLVDESRAPP